MCTQTRGQTDVVVDGTNGVYVPPGDSGALRAAITKLLDQPYLAAEMGKAGRDFVERECDVRIYAAGSPERLPRWAATEHEGGGGAMRFSRVVITCLSAA